MFQKLALLQSLGKKAPNLVDCIVTGYHRNTWIVYIYACEQIKSMVGNWKRAIEKLKTTIRLKK
jgi:hypothetical protein